MLLATRDGYRVAHPEILHETVLDMPTPEVSADSEVGGLFLQTMSQLALHRDDAWSRRAFDKLVWYLYMTGIKDGVTLRPEVVHDGECPRLEISKRLISPCPSHRRVSKDCQNLSESD